MSVSQGSFVLYLHTLSQYVLLNPQIIKQQLADGTEYRRIGLVSKGPPARQHSPILSEDGDKVCCCHHMCLPSTHSCCRKAAQRVLMGCLSLIALCGRLFHS